MVGINAKSLTEPFYVVNFLHFRCRLLNDEREGVGDGERRAAPRTTTGGLNDEIIIFSILSFPLPEDNKKLLLLLLENCLLNFVKNDQTPTHVECNNNYPVVVAKSLQRKGVLRGEKSIKRKESNSGKNQYQN